MTRHAAIDDTILQAMERHEARAHAIPNREVRDLGHAVLLHDPADPEPFWNRLASVRWPRDEAGFDRRLMEALALFATLGRRPHVWPSPAHGTPRDLARRLAGHGFRDIGGGHLMLLVDPAACAPVGLGRLGRGVTLHHLGVAGDAQADDPPAAGLVFAESFGAPPERVAELVAGVRRGLADPRIVIALVRVAGEPAAVAKATTFDGFTYLSSIGTRAAYRGRGLAGLATRHALAAVTLPWELAYLGVHTGNDSALRVYDRLGFASLGEAPDMLLR